MSAELALLLVATATVSGGLPPLAVGDPMPMWRQPVVNPARWGAPQVDLREFYRGGPRAQERLLVTFGASWCAPCRQELEALSKARAALETAAVRVAVVVADTEPEGRAELVSWLTTKLDVPFAVVVDDLGILSRRHRASQLPAAFVADATGRLVWASSGYDEAGSAQLLRTLGAR